MSPTTETRPEAAVRETIESLIDAFRRKDAGSILAHYEPGAVIFSLAPPLVVDDVEGAGLEAWLATWDGPMHYALRDLVVVAEGEVAFAHGLVHMGGRKIGAGEDRLWVRRTFGLRRREGRWLVAHDHDSVPFRMDGSLRAAVDLAP